MTIFIPKNMNLKKLLGASTLLVLVFVLAGCSKKEDFSNLQSGGGIINEELGLVFRQASLRNQMIDFSLFDEEGNEITEDATFFVNDTALEGNQFSSDAEGSFELYAEYDLDGATVTTETETFEVIIPKRKVVIEDYTGTWCGYCPRITAAIEAVREETSDIAAIAIHNGDDLSLPFEELIRQEFNVKGFPSGRINRTMPWNIPHSAEDITEFAGTNTDTGIGINSQIDGNTLSVEVSVASEANMDNKKLVVYLVEDGILRDQVNYFDNDPSSPYYQMGNPIVDFEHNDVLRASLSDIFGDAIPNTASLEEYKASYTLELLPEYVVDKLHVIAMIVEQDNTAVNSQIASVNTNKAYE